MGFSAEVLIPRLQALAYLAEIVCAERLFLKHFEKRGHYGLRYGVPLAVMFLVGMITGIPSGSSLARFAWYFLFMAWRVLFAMASFQGDPFAIVSACMAGFATQHIANKATILLRLIPAVDRVLGHRPWLYILLEILTFAAVYALIYAAFAKNIRIWSDNFHLNLLSGAIIFLCIGVNRLVADTAGGTVQHQAAVCIYAIIGCVFALIIQVYISRWEEERAQALIMRRLLADSEKQYEQWKANAELMDMVAHDVRHMLARAEALAGKKQMELPDLEAVRKAVDHFSPAVRSGNDVLDVLLRNMADLCEQKRITLNCVVRTNHLKYFDGMGLYFLFANAIDNAIGSVSSVTESDKRLIDVSIRQFGDSVMIHIWNYYTGELDFVNGLPVTKNDRQIHGFGMKSIQFIVERFHGVLNVYAENQVFHLDVLLPLEDCAPSRIW